MPSSSRCCKIKLLRSSISTNFLAIIAIVKVILALYALRNERSSAAIRALQIAESEIT